jgi:hypothetical protein
MSARLQVRDGLLVGVPTSRVEIRCEHGSSQFFVVPGQDPAANLAALQILRLRHAGRHACTCDDATREAPRPN